MTTEQFILIAAGFVYLGLLVAAVYFTRATVRRVAGALMGGVAVGVVGVVIEMLAHTLGWWRYPFVETTYGPPLMYPVLIFLFAAFALVGWRLTRRFGWRGQAAFLVAFAILGTVRDYRVAAWLPQFIVFGPGIGPVIVDIACWGGLLAFAQGVMRLVAGSPKRDLLARQPAPPAKTVA